MNKVQHRFSGDQPGIETGLEWNTSQISASTSVFDISEPLPEEQNISAMSELAFDGPGSTSPHEQRKIDIIDKNTIFQAVPSEESIIADAVASWEFDDSASVTKSKRLTEGKVLNLNVKKKRGRKTHGNSGNLDLSSISESSENSINCSAIHSATLLPKGSQVFSNPLESKSEYRNSINPPNNVYLVGQQPTTSSVVEHQLHEGKLNYSQKDISITSDHQLNSTSSTSQNSSYISDSLSNQGDLANGGADQELINNSTALDRNNHTEVNILPSIKEEPKKKQKRKAKTVLKREEPKTKSKATQVNIKTKATNKNNQPKQQQKPEEKKQQKKRQANKKDNKPQNKDGIEGGNQFVTETNNLNINMANDTDFDIDEKKRLKLLEERVTNILEMPSTSQPVLEMDNTLGNSDTVSENLNHSIATSVTSQNESKIKASKSCSIQIVKDAKNSQKINIVLPPETTLTVSKKNVATFEDSSLVQEKIKVKEEKKEKKKEKDKDSKRAKPKNEPSKKGKMNGKRTTRTPKVQKVSCGYMSSGSSEESEECSSDCSCCTEYSDSCSCSDCAGSDYCDCCYSSDSTSCSCSDCWSESSYESHHRRRHHR